MYRANHVNKARLQAAKPGSIINNTRACIVQTMLTKRVFRLRSREAAERVPALVERVPAYVDDKMLKPKMGL